MPEEEVEEDPSPTGWMEDLQERVGWTTFRDRLRSVSTSDSWFWSLALLVSAAIAAGVALEFVSTAIPPGGDPGNWVATSYIYIGHRYPSQLVPLGYPPLLFPILGLFVLVGGGAAQGVDLFVPVLLVALGLSTAWLSKTVLKSRVLALGVTAIFMAYPSTLSMVFWGAYPNLLAFVFTNVALVGVLQACRGQVSSGARLFWVGFAATVLTHSLMGVILAGWLGVFLTLSIFLELPGRQEILKRLGQKSLNSVGLGSQALLRSEGGVQGMVFFLVTCGGYYGGCALLGIPHPSYFVSNPAEFVQIPYGTTFEALAPHLVIPHVLMLEVLAGLLALSVIFFAMVLDRRPQWLEPGLVLLMGWLIAPVAVTGAGILLQIVTDYHRLGFCLVLPAGLTVAYFLDRGWVSRSPPSLAPAMSDPPARLTVLPEALAVRSPGLAQRFTLDRPAPRTAVTAVVLLFIFAILVIAGTAPALHHDEVVYTQVGHDAAFVAATHAIKASSLKGGVLTVTGADKWVKALTGDNAYAPYASVLYLFYPSQALDSVLTYYALSSHYDLTNGEVVASVRADDPAFTEGVPEYDAFLGGAVHPILSLPPGLVQVELYNEGNRTSWTESLYGAPAISMPGSLAGPMQIVYAGGGFSFSVLVTVSPYTPSATLTAVATSTGPDTILGVTLALVPASATTAKLLPADVPGNFTWELVSSGKGWYTDGTVVPASGLEGITDYDPATGGPAVSLKFNAPEPTGATQVSGAIVLDSPGAAVVVPGLPNVMETPSVWQQMGVDFILMRNASYGANPLVAVPDEVAYLHQEYGLPILYQNSEWTVLLTT